MVKRILLILTGLLFILGLFLTCFQNCSIAIPRNNTDLKTLHFKSDQIQVEFLTNALKVVLPVGNPERIRSQAKLYVSILDPDDKIVSSATEKVQLNGTNKSTYKLEIPTSLKQNTLQNYRLKYVLKYQSSEKKRLPNQKYYDVSKKIEGIKSIYSAYNHLAIKLLAQNQFIAGAPASFRLVAYNPANQKPVNNASIDIKLVNSKNNHNIPLFTGKTNNDGTVNATFKLPENEEGSFNLNVKALAYIPGKAVQEISKPINIKREYKIMLSSDKPIYQPNQTMKLRALALNAGTLRPISEKDSFIEVYDAKGNKVFKKKTKTNKYGIISADFTLADEVNMGNYKIKAIVDDIQSEKTVKVSRYVLPKFKVEFKSDKDYYLPSEVVKGSLDVNYFFGKSVNNGKVKIKVDKFDIGFSRIQEVSGNTDNSGHFDFEVQLPDNFVGQNIASGNAVVKFDIQVQDTAEHIEKKSASVLVSEQPININVIPESGNLAKNLTNTIYVMTTYPDGSPAKTNITTNFGGKEYKINSDNTGLATFDAKVKNQDSFVIDVAATDAQGNNAKKDFTIRSDSTEQSVLLRTDKSLARVGQTLNLQAVTTKPRGTIYIDMIKNNQTVLTKSMDIKNGKAEMALDIPNELVGTIGINAYIIDKNSEIIKDSKIVYINPAEDLKIAVKTDKKSFKPAEEAVIRFKVTDSNNHPILAALGVYVVDESVFALSELQPGLEKIFFTLEEEILKPRYEIHGFTPSEIVKPDDDKIILAAKQQNAAKVLFAAAEDLKGYSINVDTYSEKLQDLVNSYNNYFYTAHNKINNALYKYYRKHKSYPRMSDGLPTLLSEAYITKADLIDPWGNKMVILPSYPDQKVISSIMMISKGPDSKAGTADDVIKPYYGGLFLGKDLKDATIIENIFNDSSITKSELKELTKGLQSHNIRRKRFARMKFEDGVAGVLGAADEMVMPMAAEIKAAAPRRMLKKDKAVPKPSSNKTAEKGGGGKEEVRIREYFPETLYANAAVITDAMGNATITIPMADSITTWRLSAMGNSMNGLLGSTTSGIKVFQDFFIDINLPIALTEGDKVSVPVAIYNYLPKKQTIKLEMENEKWFESLDEMKREVTLESNQVSVEYFTIKVKKLGNHTFTVYAIGDTMSDAIKRKIRVEPDGEEFRNAINGRLEKSLSTTVTIPDKAIDDASRILVKIYPGYLSQVVEGLDKIFRMPSGCFEQTSSTTYPNVLVLDYMKRTKQITPEIQMKAESYINSGYQRLLTFEVNGGGFDWFGNPPANKILTAYGLMEFYDMSAVHDVDPNLISRTQNWLASKQEKDGSWKPDEGGIAEGAINQYKGQTLRTTAYIGWALKSSNYNGPELNSAINYIKNHLKEANDAYTLAVIANLMVLVDADDPVTDEVFKSLIKLKKEDNDTIYWEQKDKTPMYGGGKSANIETTALAAIALINYGKEVGVTNKALNYLIKAKDSFGTWHSTQATILSMKALLMSLESSTSKTNAEITVSIDGKIVEKYHIDESNSDVLKQIDLKNYTKKGQNKIDINITGDGSMLYQVVSIYYVPWELLPKPKMPALSIDIDYDKKSLAKNDIATASVTVQNNTKERADMVIVDLGIPPGFEVQTEDLDKMVKDKVITKYSIAARQVILYFDKINANDTVKFSYRVKAKISIKAKSGKSKIYKYYEPEVNDTEEPVEIQVI